jgi:hypothetical protein
VSDVILGNHGIYVYNTLFYAVLWKTNSNSDHLYQNKKYNLILMFLKILNDFTSAKLTSDKNMSYVSLMVFSQIHEKFIREPMVNLINVLMN